MQRPAEVDSFLFLSVLAKKMARIVVRLFMLPKSQLTPPAKGLSEQGGSFRVNAELYSFIVTRVYHRYEGACTFQTARLGLSKDISEHSPLEDR